MYNLEKPKSKGPHGVEASAEKIFDGRNCLTQLFGDIFLLVFSSRFHFLRHVCKYARGDFIEVRVCVNNGISVHVCMYVCMYVCILK